jgi:hypothetical protein
MNQQPPPILIPSGKELLYHFTEQKRVFIKCSHQQDKLTSWVLQDAGIFGKAAPCHVITEGVQLYPLLNGDTTFVGQTPMLFAPALPDTVSQNELQTLRKLSEEAMSGVQGTDIAVKPQEIGFQTLLNIHSSLPPTNTWHSLVLLSVVVVLAVCITYILFHTRLIKLCTFRVEPSNPDPSPPEDIEPPQTAPRTEPANSPEASAEKCVL